MIEITKDTVVGGILDLDQFIASLFSETGTHCLGCPASRGESTQEACMIHGVDPDALVEELSARLGAK